MKDPMKAIRKSRTLLEQISAVGRPVGGRPRQIALRNAGLADSAEKFLTGLMAASVCLETDPG